MANLITLARFPLLIVVAICLFAPTSPGRFAAVGVLTLVIAMDSIDGIVARARHEESVYGSLLDIMADRVVELVMWICYADLGLVPVAIPIIYVVRGTLVDGLRNAHVGEGTAPFKTMRTRLGRWLVGSPFMRTGYALAKLVSFAGLGVVHALSAGGQTPAPEYRSALAWFLVTSWLAVAICLARGIPVLVEAAPLFAKRPS
jgi:CDP-diacylglycerol--glycerol-3-phosphate 3-phosphatidyltransferase